MAAPMETELRQCDLAHYAGVGRTSARKAFRGKLRPALTPCGMRVFSAHPLVQTYINAKHGLRSRALRAARERELRAEPTPAPSTPAVDPFAVAAAHAGSGAPPAPALEPPSPVSAFDSVGHRRAHIDRTLYDLHTQTAGQLPADVEELGALTLREVVDRFGGLQALSDAVRSLKNFADMKVKEVDAAKKRGDLIERKLLTAVLMPLVDLSFKRLVGEVPIALTDRIIARVLSGGDDLKLDVETLVRDENSGVLESMRDRLVSELQEMGLG